MSVCCYVKMSFARYLSKQKKQKQKESGKNTSSSLISSLKEAKIKQKPVVTTTIFNACIHISFSCLFDDRNLIYFILTRLQQSLSTLHTYRVVRFRSIQTPIKSKRRQKFFFFFLKLITKLTNIQKKKENVVLSSNRRCQFI